MTALLLLVLAGHAGEAPSPKEVIAGALSLQDLALRKGKACETAGTPNPEDDKTVGQFLAGWLTETFVPDEGRNRRQWISAACKLDPERRAAWQCDVQMFMETVPRSETMIGGWGLRFLMDAKKRPLRKWFMCLGTG